MDLELGRFDQAKLNAEKIHQLYGPEGCGDHWSGASAYWILGDIAVARGDFLEGIEQNKTALALIQECGDKYGMVISSCRITRVCILQGDIRSAIYYNDNTLHRWYDLGNI